MRRSASWSSSFCRSASAFLICSSPSFPGALPSFPEPDHKTFVDPRVREAVSRRALLKAELTRAASPESVALTEKYQILGVPTVIFLDAAGNERRDLRLVGFEGPEEFLARLAKAP